MSFILIGKTFRVFFFKKKLLIVQILSKISRIKQIYFQKLRAVIPKFCNPGFILLIFFGQKYHFHKKAVHLQTISFKKYSFER